MALFAAILVFYDWTAAVNYIAHKVNFTEPMFVVVIMVLASTRPILKLAETIVVGQDFAGDMCAPVSLEQE